MQYLPLRGCCEESWIRAGVDEMGRSEEQLGADTTNRTLAATLTM